MAFFNGKEILFSPKIHTINNEETYNDGYEAGKKEEYDRFWDAYQENGNRIDYRYAFAGCGWNDVTFDPKYPISVTGAYGNYMFQNFASYDAYKKMTITQDVVDFSGATSADYAFSNTYADVIDVDLGNCTNLTQTFASAGGAISPTIIVKLSPATVSYPFYRNVFLENLSFKAGSKIMCNGFSFEWSTKLTHDSLLNIIDVLEDKSADTSGTSWVLTLGTTNLAKLTDTEKAIATEKGWTLA